MTLQELALFAVNATFGKIREVEIKYGRPLPDVFRIALNEAETAIFAKAAAERSEHVEALGRPLGRLE